MARNQKSIPAPVIVGPHTGDNRVQVKRGGAERASKLFDTKEAARDYAHNLAKRDGAELIEQRLSDGRIISKDSFGNDPSTIKDTEH